MAIEIVNSAFPKLSPGEIEQLHEYATCEFYNDGDTIFKAGQEDVALFVVKSGGLEIINPHNNETVALHEPGHFSGDIDLLTRRPVIVSGKAKGTTNVLRIANSNVREILNRMPLISEKFLVAFQQRRELLAGTGKLGLRVVGHSHCKDTTMIREFLHKNFVPFTFYDIETAEGRQTCSLPWEPHALPVVQCPDGKVLVGPSLRDIAHGAGIWRHCPDQEVDFAIIGAGPAGITAAVYAASEGLSTLVLDRLGPGGQAGSSSKIENFIGFPSGLSGNELATRGILQMLKFGAQIVAPVDVLSLSKSESGDGYALLLDCGACVNARVVLIAGGVRWRKLEAKNALTYERSGVYYACTSVEAVLHDGADVAVVGAGNSAGQAAMYLSECCPSRTVHMIVRSELGRSMSNYLTGRVRAAKNIRIYEHSQIEVVDGNRNIESVTVASGSKKLQLPVAAIFVFIGAEPFTQWLPDSIARDENGFLLTGAEAKQSGLWPLTRLPCPLETTLPGVLAAGDIRSGSTKRVGFAVGDGSLAVTCAHSLLNPI
jgi:thioredoxin reductase (NADPH)